MFTKNKICHVKLTADIHATAKTRTKHTYNFTHPFISYGTLYITFGLYITLTTYPFISYADMTTTDKRPVHFLWTYFIYISAHASRRNKKEKKNTITSLFLLKHSKLKLFCLLAKKSINLRLNNFKLLPKV